MLAKDAWRSLFEGASDPVTERYMPARAIRATNVAPKASTGATMAATGAEDLTEFGADSALLMA